MLVGLLLVVEQVLAGEQGCVWKQTGGCSPRGRREPRLDRRCNARVPAGASGYCVCEGGKRVAESGCTHKSFRCSEKCNEDSGDESSRPARPAPAPVPAEPAAPKQQQPASHASSSAEEAGECAWRQTGGCNYRGRREPRSDKGCDALVSSGTSGWCSINLIRVRHDVDTSGWNSGGRRGLDTADQ